MTILSVRNDANTGRTDRLDDLEVQSIFIPLEARDPRTPLALIQPPDDESAQGSEEGRRRHLDGVDMSRLQRVEAAGRLSRNQAFLMSLVDSVVDVRFCDLPEIPAGATGRFMLQQMAAVSELEAGLISERTKAALAAKVARDGQWDRNAKHHPVPGAGQAAAAATITRRARQAAADLMPIIAALRADGATSLRQLAAGLTARGIPTPRGGEWTARGVRSVLLRE